MKFLGKLGFSSAGLRLGVTQDGWLALGDHAIDDPAALFLAYQDGDAHWVLQCWLGSWVRLIAAQAPNAWYPVLYAAATGSPGTRLDLGWLDLHQKKASFVFADEEGRAVSLMTTGSLNPHCRCHFDVGAGAFYGTRFDLEVRSPGLDEILRTREAAGRDFGPVGQAQVNFSDTRFTDVDFRTARLKQAVLDRCTFLRCNLGQADLGGASLVGTDLVETWIAGADLSGCDLTQAVMPPTPWSDEESPRTVLRGSTLAAQMLGRDWSGLDLTGATLLGLDRVDLNGLKATGSIAPSLDLSGRLLRAADFSGSQLERCNFRGAELTAALFCSASLVDCNFSAARLDESRFSPSPRHGVGTDLTGASFDGASARGAQFNNALLHGARFIQADLAAACFAGARLGTRGRLAASFSHAYLENACFDKAEMHGVDFSHVSLFGPLASFHDVVTMQQCNFSNAYLEGVNLSGADLRGAHGAGACLVNARLSQVLMEEVDGVRTSLASAALQGACFLDARLEGADLSGAAVALDPGTIPVRHCNAEQHPSPTPPAETSLRFNPTTGLDLASMGAHTICPNGFTVQENLAQHRSVHEMLTAANAPRYWYPTACAGRDPGGSTASNSSARTAAAAFSSAAATPGPEVAAP